MTRESERMYRLARDKELSFRDLLMYGKDADHRRCPSSNAMRALEDCETEADILFDELLFHRKRTEEIIELLPDPLQRETLIRRYVIGQRWEDIAEVMNYDLRWVYRLHKNALTRLSNTPL